jgi:hypothetical protein
MVRSSPAAYWPKRSRILIETVSTGSRSRGLPARSFQARRLPRALKFRAVLGVKSPVVGSFLISGIVLASSRALSALVLPQ